jgi:superfamily II DNA or RNA helicase
MSKLILEDIISSRKIEDLPLTWLNFDFSSFSSSKTLYDYQIKALQSAAKLLHLFYEESKDFSASENQNANSLRRQYLLALFLNNNFDENKFSVGFENKNIFNIYSNYYKAENDKILFGNFINRCSFWMATGSGKSLLIVKLIVLLNSLINQNEIPANDILILAPREDLLEQLKELIEEYNSSAGNHRINLYSLKDYARVKNENFSFYDEISVFYYRSDNISDEQKDVQIDYRNYENNGNWYILLDEAHKGGKEDSKRQSYYSILSRNGFLFNFSATFTDEWDLATTVFNFNLEKFITEGYGKHLYVSGEEYISFRTSGNSRNLSNGNDYTQEEKEKIVIKSLLTLAYCKEYARKAHRKDKTAYHSPLMLTLVNSVNTEESDLLIFFNVLVKFARGQISISIFNQAKAELLKELKNKNAYIFEEGSHTLPLDSLLQLNIGDVLKYVFNSSGYGEIEVTTNSSSKELAFKLQVSEKPFALIKIGDISEWIKNKLNGYEFTKTYDDDSYFRKLNDNPQINILMGSRAFYEGWDSNRPNVINYINIGTSTDAQKFILQSLGRGVRISPYPNKRMRLINLRNSNQLEQLEYDKLKDAADTLESLFIFGTNKSAIQKVVETVKRDSSSSLGQTIIELSKNEKIFDLLIPVYDSKSFHIEELPTFHIAGSSKDKLSKYLATVNDNVLLFTTSANLKDLSLLRNSVESGRNISIDESKKFNEINIAVNRFSFHINSKRKYLKEFKKLEEEIIHFRKITVANGVNVESLLKVIKESLDSLNNNSSRIIKLLDEDYKANKISEPEFKNAVSKLEIKSEYSFGDLKIQNILDHYYLPVLTSDIKLSQFKHIIDEPSEFDFLQKLSGFVKSNEYVLKQKYDWWMFSKIDESLDKIFIPYSDGDIEKSFFPDFIFWLNKGKDYKIIFIDPKGTAHAAYQLKADGFEKIFNNKLYKYSGYDINVSLKFYTEKHDCPTGRYEEYWINNPSRIF